MTTDASLDAVRRKIDEIDDQIQDLVIARTELVEQVRALKRDAPIKIRPAREAEIIYRLVGRHRGPFPKRDLAAIWRLLITATLAFEGPFSVAVFTPHENGGYWDLARDHFGSAVPMTRHASVRSVLEAVHRQDATVGVLPMVAHDDADPWWRHIVTNQPGAPRIVGRLPFAGRGNGVGGDLEALIVCPLQWTPCGRDRSLFALDLEPGLGLNQVRKMLTDNGLAPTLVVQWREDAGTGAWLYLFEIDGWVAPDDPRLAALEERFATMFKRCIRLGGYARPLSAAELAPAAPPTLEPPVAKSPERGAGRGAGRRTGKPAGTPAG